MDGMIRFRQDGKQHTVPETLKNKQKKNKTSCSHSLSMTFDPKIKDHKEADKTDEVIIFYFFTQMREHPF